MTKIYRATPFVHFESLNQGKDIFTTGFLSVSRAMAQQTATGQIALTNSTTANNTPDIDTIMLGASDDDVQSGIKSANIMTPFCYSRTQNYSVLGTIGVNTAASGLTLTNDTIYAFPVFVGNFPTGVTKVKFGVSVADASATGDIEVSLYKIVHGTGIANADADVGPRLTAAVTLSDISTTGLKTVTISAISGGGPLWVCLRPDNIGTALTLSQPLATQSAEVVKFFGLANPETNTPIYGVYYSSQTTMPTTLFSTAISGYITTPVGITISEL